MAVPIPGLRRMVGTEHRHGAVHAATNYLMDPPVLLRSLLVLAAAVGLETAPLGAQEPRPDTGFGRIEGMVFDSAAGAPLPDAAVFLWGTPHRGVSDDEGRFVIEGVPPGTYTLLFYHARLGAMGISAGPTQVTVDAGTVVHAELGTPSMFTLVTSQCLLEERGGSTGTVAGWVADGSSGMGLPGAMITLSWNVQGSREPRRREVPTDEEGWYRVCDAPGDTPITLAARFLSLQGLRREVAVRPGGVAEAAFLLWDVEPGRVSGAVHDATTGAGVEGAEVWLRGTSMRALTGKNGAFRLGEVPPGTYTFVADHLRYGTRQDTLVVPSGRTLQVEMRVDQQAIELDPLTVEVEAVPLTQRAMGGFAITRPEIEKLSGRGLRDAADVLQALNVSGVIVKRRADGSLCVGYMPGQVRMMSSGGCVSMEVYVNDVHATNKEMALHIPPEAIDRIVLFRPVEAGNLFPINAANGVMVIYTRR